AARGRRPAPARARRRGCAGGAPRCAGCWRTGAARGGKGARSWTWTWRPRRVGSGSLPGEPGAMSALGEGDGVEGEEGDARGASEGGAMALERLGEGMAVGEEGEEGEEEGQRR